MPTAVRAAGLVFMCAGTAFFITAMTAMKDNWRAGFDENQRTNLVKNGVYKISRNPAFVGFDLLYLGCATVFPNAFNMAAAVISILLFHLQILGEENFCATAFGDEYTRYKAKTMRYIGTKR